MEERAKTLDELHNKYGFKEMTVEDGKVTLNPVYKKHMNKTWEIQNVYALLNNAEISTGKARELTAAIIESSDLPLDFKSELVKFGKWYQLDEMQREEKQLWTSIVDRYLVEIKYLEKQSGKPTPDKPLDQDFIGKEIESNGNKIIPIVELCKMQLRRIYGENFEEYFRVDKILSENENFGVIGTYFSDRVGFTLQLKEEWKEFELTCGDQRSMMINQLEMFDQLRKWGFSI